MAEACLGGVLAWAAVLGGPGSAPAQTKPEGEMRFAVYVTMRAGLARSGRDRRRAS